MPKAGREWEPQGLPRHVERGSKQPYTPSWVLTRPCFAPTTRTQRSATEPCNGRSPGELVPPWRSWRATDRPWRGRGRPLNFGRRPALLFGRYFATSSVVRPAAQRGQDMISRSLSRRRVPARVCPGASRNAGLAQAGNPAGGATIVERIPDGYTLVVTVSHSGNSGRLQLVCHHGQSLGTSAKFKIKHGIFAARRVHNHKTVFKFFGRSDQPRHVKGSREVAAGACGAGVSAQFSEPRSGEELPDERADQTPIRRTRHSCSSAMSGGAAHGTPRCGSSTASPTDTARSLTCAPTPAACSPNSIPSRRRDTRRRRARTLSRRLALGRTRVHLLHPMTGYGNEPSPDGRCDQE